VRGHWVSGSWDLGGASTRSSALAIMPAAASLNRSEARAGPSPQQARRGKRRVRVAASEARRGPDPFPGRRFAGLGWQRRIVEGPAARGLPWSLPSMRRETKRRTVETVVRAALRGLAMAVVIALTLAGPADAQGQWVRVDGRVQWLSGQKMMLI